jgi:UDP-GlcNAc:undecaprenyl-phosphate GlcNAc-1-phosphate transferase
MLARRLGWVYLPNDRTVHDTALPDIGGLAMYIGFVVAFMAAWLAGSLDVLFESNSEPWGVLIAATIIFVVGLIDDVRDISAPAKVFGAVLAGVVLVYFGVEMFAFRIPFYEGAIFLDESLSPLITVLWLVGMSQAINLIDGLDGLAAGIVGIGAVAFFLYSERLATLDLLDTANVGPLLAVVAAGICFGFLPHNFNPARIFMGDGGALLLGLLMAAWRLARSRSARRTSSSHRWRSRSSFWAYQSSTRSSQSSDGLRADRVLLRLTRVTCITASWRWATATDEASSSFGRGQHCSVLLFCTRR